MTEKPSSGSIVTLSTKFAHQHLAGEPVAAVDTHRVRSADTVRARAAVGQRSVGVPFDLVERVEHPIGSLGLDLIFLEDRLVVDFRVITLDAERDLHGFTFRWHR